MALIVVTDHILLSCGQLMFIWGSYSMLLSLCGGVMWGGGGVGFAKSFSCPTQLQC